MHATWQVRLCDLLERGPELSFEYETSSSQTVFADFIGDMTIDDVSILAAIPIVSTAPTRRQSGRRPPRAAVGGGSSGSGGGGGGGGGGAGDIGEASGQQPPADGFQLGSTAWYLKAPGVLQDKRRCEVRAYKNDHNGERYFIKIGKGRGDPLCVLKDATHTPSPKDSLP